MGASEPLSCGEVTHKGHGGAEPGGWVSHVFQGRGLLHGSPSPPPTTCPWSLALGAPRENGKTRYGHRLRPWLWRPLAHPTPGCKVLLLRDLSLATFPSRPL